MKRCATCGQIIPPDLALGPVKQTIYNALCKAPRTAEELRELVWGNRDIGWKTIHAHMWGLRRALRPHGLAIRNRWRGAYHLVSL